MQEHCLFSASITFGAITQKFGTHTLGQRQWHPKKAAPGFPWNSLHFTMAGRTLLEELEQVQSYDHCV